MSSDLSDLFATIRADADRVMLTPAETLRRRADRRARRRALGIACAGVLALVAIVGVSFVASRRTAALPMPPAGPSVSSPVGTPPPSSSSPSPTPAPSYRACRSADLSFVSSSFGGAMGHILDDYTVRNNAADPCQLSGEPVITYVNSRGTAALLPAEPPGTPGDPVGLQPGGTAKFWIERAGQGAGNITSGPTCVHNGVYPGLAIRFPDGSSLPLGGNSLQVWCGGIFIGDWMPA